MPRTRNLSHYPHEAYGAIFAKVEAGGPPVTLPARVGTLSAVSLQGKLYAFRRACQRHRAEAEALGLNVDHMLNVCMTITKEGELVLQLRNETPEAKAIMEILGNMGGAPKLKTAADQALESVQAKLGGKP